MLLFSHPVMSDSLRPHELQDTRPPCPSPSSEVCPSSCPLHQWCHPAILSSNTLFSFCFQSFPASGTFPVNQLFISGDQNTGASASATIHEYSGFFFFSFRLTGLISLLSKGLSGVFSSSKASILWHFAFFTVQLSHPYVTTGKTITLTIRTFVSRVTSLLFSTLSRFVIAFLPNFMAAVTTCTDFRAQEEICHYFLLFPYACHEVMGPDTMILVVLIFSFKLALSLSSFTLIKRLFSSSSVSY